MECTKVPSFIQLHSTLDCFREKERKKQEAEEEKQQVVPTVVPNGTTTPKGKAATNKRLGHLSSANSGTASPSHASEQPDTLPDEILGSSLAKAQLEQKLLQQLTDNDTCNSSDSG